MKQKLGRSWDTFDAYLFDIDGTLIQCTDATHYFAFSHALKMLSGRELTIEGVTAHGNTDIGIVRDAFALAGIPENQWRPHVGAIRRHLGDFVETRKADLCTITLPKVREVLEHLQGKGAKLAVATGNLERIGKLKLERSGLLDYFQFGGWSDAHEYRSDVFRAAIVQARELWGGAAALCVVGDTPADILAAHDHDVPVIAVATGIYTFEQLMQERPEMCLHSLEELCPQSKSSS
jgi:phosphoglycolate phosphatase-like HAD superfamily hydrolase